MLKIEGNLEVFQNDKGYAISVIKAFEDKELLGKIFVDTKLPKGVELNKGETLTLNVKEGYLNAVHVEAGQFTKLQINVVDCEVVKVFPERKEAKKASKRGTK